MEQHTGRSAMTELGQSSYAGTVYLLHFTKPLYHARHYIGYTQSRSIRKRLDRHYEGHGSHLTGAAVNAGIGFLIGGIWPDKDRRFERKLHNTKNGGRYCAICAKEKGIKAMCPEGGVTLYGV